MIEAKNIQQLDFNLLKVFECLYQERNMTVTAKILFISPSAVSHAIKRLRATLNDELFVRQGQAMQPTAACQRMAPQLLDTLDKLRQILQACGDFNLSSTTQTFRLATHDALEPVVLPKIQQLLAKYTPKAKFTSSKLIREYMHRQLSTNQIDIAIDVALPLRAPIKHVKLSSDHFCVLMRKANPVALNLNEHNYLTAQHIAVSNRSSGAVVEDIALFQQGINREVNMRCQSYQAAKDVIKTSDYLLTLPSIIANQLIDNDVIINTIPFALPKIETHLYWHKNTEQDDALKWLRSQIQSIFNLSSI